MQIALISLSLVYGLIMLLYNTIGISVVYIPSMLLEIVVSSIQYLV